MYESVKYGLLEVFERDILAKLCLYIFVESSQISVIPNLLIIMFVTKFDIYMLYSHINVLMGVIEREAI